MSSPYVVLGNRTLDQWKVTELKEELKRRKLTTKGLKEDLVKRLDEAVRAELEIVNNNVDNDLSSGPQSDLTSDQAVLKSVIPGYANNVVDEGIDKIENIDSNHKKDIDDHIGSSGENKVVTDDAAQEASMDKLESGQVADFATLGTTVVVRETDESMINLSELHSHSVGTNEDSTTGPDNNNLKPPRDDNKLEPSIPSPLSQSDHSSFPVEPPTGTCLQHTETHVEVTDSMFQTRSDDAIPLQEDQSVHSLKHQVSEVDTNLGFQVISDSVSAESVSIIENNELKVDVITDNVKLELDVKSDMVQPSVRDVVPDGGESHPMDVKEPLEKGVVEEPLDKKYVEEPHNRKDVQEPVDRKDQKESLVQEDFEVPPHKKDVEEASEKKVSMEQIDGINSGNADGLDLGPERLSLDRSSGDDSMEEDVTESKQTEYKSDSNVVPKPEMHVGKEDIHVDIVGDDKNIETKVANAEDKAIRVPTSVKRKSLDKEAAVDNDTVKRACRWNVEPLKGSDVQSINVSASAIPRDSSQSTFKRFSRSDSAINDEAPKEGVVPPSPRPPSNSLRIDRFLRPFTLKAVQELLGKTGTVTSFWMDHIKTHCYVSYSSVEEAVETRNAVYNLQWPQNGGRLLVAEFVDPQEVKARLEAPAVSPATPSGAAPMASAAQPQANVQSQPSPREQVPRQQVPPPFLPLPPLSNPPAREKLHPPREHVPLEQPLPARDRFNLPPPPPLPEKIDPPIVTLDDLFRKTRASPRLYYLPLSDEQVAAKLKAQGKNAN